MFGLGTNGEESGRFEYSTHDLTVRLTFEKCHGRGLSLSDCPTSSGQLESSGSSHFEVTQEVRDGATVLSRTSTTFDDTIATRGQVGSDARLKYIDISYTEDVLIVATGGVVSRGRAVRNVRVDMPGGHYDPAGASVTLSGDSIAGVKDDAFASTVDSAISIYRDAEAGWRSLDRKPYCAEAVFDPASNTIKLHKGQGGQLGIYAKARQDGAPATGARWSLLNPTNATFSPSSSSDAAPRITYTVATAPTAGNVQVTARFTSTAGVGEATWQQPVDSQINHIGGAFSGNQTFSTSNGDSALTFTGSVQFDRSTPTANGGAEGDYTLSSGDYTLTASGKDGSGLTACDQAGSQHLTIQPGDGSLSVDPGGPPYSYMFRLPESPQSMTVTRTRCPPNDSGFEGTTYQAGLFQPIETKQSHTSQDGADYQGTETDSQGGFSFTRNWSFTGTP